MASDASLNPYTTWAEMRRAQATRAASACSGAVHDVLASTVHTRHHVAMTANGQTDVGVLRLEFDRLVFAGPTQTRLIEFASIVLLGTREMIPPEPPVCSVNNNDYDATMLFWCAEPLEYHIAAWYSRWLEAREDYPAMRPAAMVELPHHPR
jgi:hypothetical protein